MEITEVRVKLMENSEDRLRAFCSITFDDCFVVRDLKIIEGTNGPFVAMPSRKLTDHCPQCGTKNHLRANYCSQCGSQLDSTRTIRSEDGRAKLYADIAHPINSKCRESIQDRVIDEYEAELERAEDPDYVSRYDDMYGDDDLEDYDTYEQPDPARSGKSAISTQIQPAESTPPPPHQKPRSATSSSPLSQGQGGFGAGIFEE
jgi:stage V sporulation protein G